MAKGTTTDFSEQNTKSAMQVMDWMRDMTEQSLNQSKSALEGFFTTARKASEDIDEQASELRKRSLLLAQETLSNTFNFAHKIVHARKPQDLFQLQSEFISRQAQVIAEQSKELGQTAVRRAQEVGRTPHQGMAETSRRGPKPLKGKSW